MEAVVTEHEVVDHREAVPAAEVFPSDDQILAKAKAAVESGVITTVPFDPELEHNADILPTVAVTLNDLVEGSVPDVNIEHGLLNTFDRFKFKNPEDILQRTAKAIHDEEVQEVAERYTWYKKDPDLEKYLSNGLIRQAFEVASEDEGVISIINLSETKLNEDQVEEIRRSIDRTNQLSAGRNFEVVKAVCILPENDFADKTIGNAFNKSRTIILNESVINGNAEKAVHARGDIVKFSEHGLSFLESTLTHEQWHLLELRDPAFGYAPSVGWNIENKYLQDDYGNVIQKRIQSLDEDPYQLKATKNGKLVDVNTRDEYGEEAVRNAKPATEYGRTNPREDSAESFVPYSYTERDDNLALDIIRRGAITGILQRLTENRKLGPRITTVTEINPRDLITIHPATMTVREPWYSLEGTVSVKPPVPQTDSPSRWYYPQEVSVVDDYGNTVSTRKNRQPNISG